MAPALRSFLPACALFLVLAVAYVGSIPLRASRGAEITGDEPFYLLTTQSILRDGDLDLRNQYAARSYEEFFDHPAGLWYQMEPLPDGRLLSPHNPGLSLLLVPGFAIGGLRGAQTELLLIAAATFTLAYLASSRITGDARWSWASAAVVGLTATPFVYATEVYPEVPAACALLGALLLRPGRGIGATAAVVALLSALVWLGVKYAPLAIVVAVWWFWQARAGERIFLAMGSLLSAAAFTWFHLETFGALTPYSVSTVWAGESTAAVVAEHVSFVDRAYRLYGIFLDARFGLLVWAPVLAAAIVAAPRLVARSMAARWWFALILAQLLVATFVAITMMGWWFPGRTMMTVLPLFVPFLAAALRDAPAWGRALTAAVAALSLWYTARLAVAATTGEVTVAVDPFEMPDRVFQGWRVLFPDYRSWTPPTVARSVLWVMAIGAAAFAAGSAGRLTARGRFAETRT